MLDPAATLSIFQRQSEAKAFPAGTTIFEAGQPGDFMYGILEGEVDLLVNGRVVESIAKGEVFGAGALIGVGARTYTAVARTECKLAYLDEKRFLFAVQETPVFAIKVMKSYSERLNRLIRSV